MRDGAATGPAGTHGGDSRPTRGEATAGGGTLGVEPAGRGLPSGDRAGGGGTLRPEKPQGELATGEAVRFATPAAGRIAAGRRRVAALFLGLSGLVAAAAVVAFAQGRIWPGFIAMAVAIVPLLAWRMSGDLVPRWIEVGGGAIRLCTRGRLFTYPLAGASVRPLDGAERDHLARLASAGGVVVSAGGFDSHLLGEFELFAGDLERAVLLEAGEERLVVTPDDPERFAALVAERSGRPPR